FASAAQAGKAETASATARHVPRVTAERVGGDGWERVIVYSPFIWPVTGDLPVRESRWGSAERWDRIGQGARACERAEGASSRVCRAESRPWRRRVACVGPARPGSHR